MSEPYDTALGLVLEHQKGSTSWLQRQMRIGYNEAARHIDRMQAEGYLSAPDHVGRREVLRPPSAALPGSSVQPEPNPWERNAGKFDEPTSGTPGLLSVHRQRRSLDWVPPEPLVVTVEREAPAEGERSVEELAAELVSMLGVEGARMTVRTAAERDGMLLRPHVGTPAAEWLTRIVERVRVLFEQRRALGQEIRDAFSFAKDIGLNVKALRKVIADLEADKDQRFETEANHAIYRSILAVEDPDFVVELPAPIAPPPAKTRKITAREKQFRDALALTQAAHAIIDQ